MKNKLIASLAVLVFFATCSVAHAAGVFNSDLSYGMTDNLGVQALQTFLTKQGLYSGPISGNFFTLTQAGVKKYQTSVGLPSTGFVGPLTRVHINTDLAAQPTSSTQNEIAETGMSTPSAVCTGGALFNKLTGQSCNQYVPVSTGPCTSNAVYNSQTGALCSTNPAPITQPTPVQSNPTSPSPNSNYSSYTPVTFSQYQNDSTAYIGDDVIVTGMNDSFIPSTGNVGSTNYVEVENPFDLTQPKIELKVDDPTAYAAIVNALQDKSQPTHLFLRAYGVAVPSQQFTSNNAFRSATIQVPVLDASRVDQCLQGSMSGTVLIGTSFESNFSCSSWSTIVPLSLTGTVWTTPTPPLIPVTPVTPVPPTTPSPTLNSDATLKSLTVNGTSVTGFSPTTYAYTVTLPAGSASAPTVSVVTNDTNATEVITQASDSLGSATVVVTAQNGTTRNTYTLNFKPSDAGQCNVGGNIFTCASNSGITLSPTSLPAATVGSPYTQPVIVSDPDTSSENFRWNIISGSLPPGLGLAFSSSQAIECSGSYCFFTTPNISVPSNSPGMFFGTPTTAGTYSFTLQAIDSLNYTALPTFTITVVSST